MLGNAVSRAFHDFPGHSSYAHSGKLMPNTSQDSRPKTCFLHEGSFKKGLGQWGRSVGPGPRAHIGLGISVPYNSNP